jgi:hypothetical protein
MRTLSRAFHTETSVKRAWRQKLLNPEARARTPGDRSMLLAWPIENAATYSSSSRSVLPEPCRDCWKSFGPPHRYEQAA